MNKIISIELYDRDVMVHFGSRKELRKELAKHFPKAEAKEIAENFADEPLGRTLLLHSGQVILYMPKLPLSVADFGTLQHEIFHAAFFILDKAGITLASNCDEAYSCLIQFLTKRILEGFPISFSRDARSA